MTPQVVEPQPFTLAYRTKELTRVTKARVEAERQAWSSLARYKFWMFGYHAAQWVLLNRLADKKDRQRNPFKDLVQIARMPRIIEGDEADFEGMR